MADKSVAGLTAALCEKLYGLPRLIMPISEAERQQDRIPIQDLPASLLKDYDFDCSIICSGQCKLTWIVAFGILHAPGPRCYAIEFFWGALDIDFIRHVRAL